MEEFPAHLEYTGIYRLESIVVPFSFKFTPCRYLNNPEAMGGAAWFGLALISGSKLVFALAVIRHLANWWFLSNVEKYVTCLNLYSISHPPNYVALTCANSMVTRSEKTLASLK